MVFSFFSKNKGIADRSREDYATKMRLNYAPWYQTMESQRGTRVTMDGREMVMLTSNDYLGLSQNPKVIEAAKAALDQWGTSTTGSRAANGSRAFHRDLEEDLAGFLGKEACHITAAGYISCISAVAAFAQKGDLIVADKNIHSSLWDGIRLSMAAAERFSHNSTSSLREALQSAEPSTPKMLVVEGVYSMEGHIAPLPEIIAVAEEFGAFSVVDDSHGFGVMGKAGRGTVDHFQLSDRVDLIAGSMSKSLGSTGGFVAGSQALIEYLRTHSRQTIFSAAISPSQTGAAREALRLLQGEPEHLQKLWRNTRRYHQMLRSLNLDTWESDTPAVPVVLGSKELAYRFWKLLLEKGVFTVMSIAPAVPPGKDLIRTAITALHSDEDLDRIEEAFSYAVKKL